MTSLQLAKAGAYFAYDEAGVLVSLQDLLERERGHEVSPNVAMNYLFRNRVMPDIKQKVAKFISYARTHKHVINK